MRAAWGPILALLLAACQGPTAPAPEAPPEPEPLEEIAGPRDVPAASAAAAPEIATRPGPTETPESALDDDPAELIGLDPAALEARLGRPALIRREAPAQIWQYEAEACVFDVFLYEAALGYRVTYLEARDGTARPVEARACLNALLRARLASGQG